MTEGATRGAAATKTGPRLRRRAAAGDPAFAALAQVVRAARHRRGATLFELLDGFAMDVEEARYATLDDTLRLLLPRGRRGRRDDGADHGRRGRADARPRLRSGNRLPADQHRARRHRGCGRALLPARRIGWPAAASPRATCTCREHHARAGKRWPASWWRRPSRTMRSARDRHRAAAVALGLGDRQRAADLPRYRPAGSGRAAGGVERPDAGVGREQARARVPRLVRGDCGGCAQAAAASAARTGLWTKAD